jgi:hypothetical protein
MMVDHEHGTYEYDLFNLPRNREQSDHLVPENILLTQGRATIQPSV